MRGAFESVSRGSFALAACFAVALAPSTLGQCADRDADGCFPVSGCGGAKDCSDQSAEIHPGAAELCNGFDDDCNGWWTTRRRATGHATPRSNRANRRA